MKGTVNRQDNDIKRSFISDYLKTYLSKIELQMLVKACRKQSKPQPILNNPNKL